MNYVLFVVALCVAIGWQSPVAALTACTQMWCDEGISMQFQPAISGAGSYEFDVVLDGATTHCKAVLPLPSCEQRVVTCDNDNVMIMESGCALPPSAQNFPAMKITVMAKTVEVRIKTGAGKRHSSRHAITPSCSYPNGKHCSDKPCCSAQVNIPVRWQ